MFDANELFKERLASHIKLLNRYLRYLFNGHFMIALLFLIITLAIYYQHWLEDLSADFPSAIIIAIVVGAAISYNPIQTFLKEPDKVFLIVKEQEMSRYFIRTLLYNYVVQLYVLVVSLAATGPLYMKAFPMNDMTDFMLLSVLALVIKAWNFAANWMMFKVRNKNITLLDKLIRTVLSIGILYTLLEGLYPYVIVVIFFGVIISDYYLAKKQSGIAWDVLIENDQHRLSAFLRFVSNFAEVPQLTRRLKKRRILATFIEQRVPFRQSDAFHYLYRLTFIRSNDYLNLYVRLTVIGAIIMYFIPNGWMKLAIALLFVYMTSFQLIPLYQHYRTSIWIDLYPLNKELQRKSYLKDMKVLTILQAVLFSLIFLVFLDFQGMLFMLIGGFLFMYLFYNGYVKKKLA